MRKIVAFIMIVIILLCLLSCSSSKDTIGSNSDVSLETSIESVSDDTTTEESANTESNTESDDESTVEKQVSSPQQSSSSPQTSSSQQSSSQQSTINTQPITPTKTKPNFGKFTTSIKDLTQQLPYYTIDLPGIIVDCLVDEDLIYVLYKNENLINLYNGNTGTVVYSNSLPGRPAEMHIYGDELWISFPDLSYINIYSKSDLKMLRTMEIDRNIFSFDVYDNLIFYVGESREQFVYKYNITTQTNERLDLNNGTMMNEFFEPAILADKNILYVAETNTTACKLYMYNIDTMELHGVFEDTPYSGYSPGFGNYVRKLLLLDGYIYWNNFKLNPAVLWKAETSYGSENGGDGILFADSDYVATRLGVYTNTNGKMVIPFKPWSSSIEKNSKFAITKSKNIIYSDGIKMYIFYG